MLSTSARSTLQGKASLVAFVVIVNVILFSTLYHYDVSLPPQLQYVAKSSRSLESIGDAMSAEIAYYSSYELKADDIAQRGVRSEVLRKWITSLELLDLKSRQNLTTALDDHLISLYPFLNHTSRDSPYLSSLRENVVPGSRGIVISAGKKSFRWAAHVIGNIRSGVGSELPIQIAYAGEKDLPEEHRSALEALGPDISSFNILDHFDDKLIGITHGLDWGYSTKPFAILASTFEEVLLVDADGTFLQRPERILDEHSGYQSTGALLFRDRAGWWTSGKDRTQYYHQLMKHHRPSQTLVASKIWQGAGSEHGESALVVMDKSRLEILMALIHICWQNTLAVRKKSTYRKSYGDKESWWMGLELTGAPYTMDKHYAGRMGEAYDMTRDVKYKQEVCSNAMLHFDHMERPLWFNGGLLKARKDDPDTYITPQSWRWIGDDGEWYSDMCLGNGVVHNLTVEETSVLERSVARAKALDAELKSFF